MRAKYRQIVDRIAADIHSGRLRPGDRLPTHRQLAYEHGLALGTATRVFAELDAMGLTMGEIGRGTFVRRQADARATGFVLHGELPDAVDFSINHFILPEQEAMFSAAVREVVSEEGPDVLGYRDNAGSERDRRTVWGWLNTERRIPIPDPEALTICAGGQHGLLLSLMAVCRPGDVVAVEPQTYPVIRQTCALLRLDVVEVGTDADGIRPDALEALCRETPVRLLFAMPNLQNPTSVSMPEARRHALARVIRRLDLYAIEDDAYGFLLEAPPVTLHELMPEHVFYLRSLSKSWAPGLRVGYLVAPRPLAEAVDMAQRGSVWMSGPLMASVATRLIEDGGYARIVAAKRREIARRQEILAAVLGSWSVQTSPHSMHAIVWSPRGARTSTLLAALRDDHVIAAPLAQFAAARDVGPVPEGFRLCLGAPPDRARLKVGLSRIAAALTRGQAL